MSDDRENDLDEMTTWSVDEPTQGLTPEEHQVMEWLGKAANGLYRICYANGGNQAKYDWAEAAQRVHALQHTVMAQAASRAHPDRYRPLGGWPEGSTDE